MPSDVGPTPQEIAARYFEMWNTGDSLIATEILSPRWVDHAHPEVTGPDSVRQAVEDIRVAQPGLRFHIESILADGDGLVAVVGAVHRGTQVAKQAPRLIWLIRVMDGRMTEMWTYRDTRG